MYVSSISYVRSKALSDKSFERYSSKLTLKYTIVRHNLDMVSARGFARQVYKTSTNSRPNCRMSGGVVYNREFLRELV